MIYIIHSKDNIEEYLETPKNQHIILLCLIPTLLLIQIICSCAQNSLKNSYIISSIFFVLYSCCLSLIGFYLYDYFSSNHEVYEMFIIVSTIFFQFMAIFGYLLSAVNEVSFMGISIFISCASICSLQILLIFTSLSLTFLLIFLLLLLIVLEIIVYTTIIP